MSHLKKITLYHHHTHCHSYRLQNTYIQVFRQFFDIFCQTLVPELCSRTSARKISPVCRSYQWLNVIGWQLALEYHVNISEYTKPYTDSYLLNKYAMEWKCLILHELSVKFKKMNFIFEFLVENWSRGCICEFHQTCKNIHTNCAAKMAQWFHLLSLYRS